MRIELLGRKGACPGCVRASMTATISRKHHNKSASDQRNLPLTIRPQQTSPPCTSLATPIVSSFAQGIQLALTFGAQNGAFMMQSG